MNKKILVIGGTGMLGKPVSRQLREAGYGVRIMSRNPEKARKIFDTGYEIFSGDPSDLACLDEAMQGCGGVHISLPTGVEQPVAELVANAAPSHGIERITYISGATVAEEHRSFQMIDRKFKPEQALIEGVTPSTIFCVTWTMEGLALFVNQGKAVVFGNQPFPYRWVAGRDLGKLVSGAYSQNAATNQRFFVYGPEAIRLPDALRRYCARFHPEVKPTSMPLWLVRGLAAVTRDPGITGAGELMAYFEKVGEQNSTANSDCRLGLPSTTLDQRLEMQG